MLKCFSPFFILFPFFFFFKLQDCLTYVVGGENNKVLDLVETRGSVVLEPPGSGQKLPWWLQQISLIRFGPRHHCEDKEQVVFSFSGPLFASFTEVVVVRTGRQIRPNSMGEQLTPLYSSSYLEGFIFYPALASLPFLLTYYFYY